MPNAHLSRWDKIKSWYLNKIITTHLKERKQKKKKDIHEIRLSGKIKLQNNRWMNECAYV